jgi:phage shock protein A
MADTEHVGIIRAFVRLITFYGLRKRLGLVRAADRMFTGSASGISDAFDLHRDEMVRRYRSLFDSVSQVETVVEERRIELEKLGKEHSDLVAKREGAATAYEKAEAAADQEALQKHKAALVRFQGLIKANEDRSTTLEQQMNEQRTNVTRFEAQLTALQAEIQNLPAEKAQAVADFVSNQKLIELNSRMSGITESMDRGPIDAVLQANRELAAKARVSQRLAGTDTRKQDAEYLATGAKATASEEVDQLLAARKAARDAKTGASATSEKKEERPKI